MKPISSEDLYKFLYQICKNVTKLLGAGAASIYLIEDDSLVMRAAYGYPNNNLVGIARYALGEGITGWIGLGNEFIASSRAEVESHKAHAGKYDKELWGHDAFHCWSFIGVPLRLDSNVIGLIKVENKKYENSCISFSKEDLEDLNTYAKIIIDSIKANDEFLKIFGNFYVFVLIPFNKDYNNIYNLGIKEAVKELNMRCERLDEIEFNIDMLNQLYKCINRADIIISELSDKNPNVYYETGYSHALNKPTVHIAQDAKAIPFDLNHYNTIIYDHQNIMELKEKIKRRLSVLKNDIIKNTMPMIGS